MARCINGCLFLVALIALLFTKPVISGPLPKAEDIGLNSDRLHAIVADGAVKYGLPSLQVAVVFDTAIIFSDVVGYARFSDSLAATTSTVYRVGSVTKPITATMLVMLTEAQVVRLDDSVAKYVPEYRPWSPFPDTRPTTLFQLATHQAGLPRSSPLDYLSEMADYYRYVEGIELPGIPETTRELFLQSLSQIELEYPPYSPYGHYSNLGFRILGLALERASNGDFTTYIQRNVFGPLAMTRSGFDPRAYAVDALATGYVYVDSISTPKAAKVEKPDLRIYSGGVYSTAEDLCRFLSLQFQTAPKGGAQIVSADGLRMMQWTAMDWSFSFDPRHPALEHGGGVPGFNAHVIAIPSLKTGVAVINNRSDMIATHNPSKEIAWQLVAQLRQGIANYVTASEERPIFSKHAYVGRYVLANQIAVIEITLENDTLFSTNIGFHLPKSALFECDPGVLCFVDDLTRTAVLEFDRAKDQRPTRLSIGGYHFEREN